MPTQAQPLVAMLSRSHSTSFFTSTVRTCNWSRTRRTASRIRCSSVLVDEAAVGRTLARRVKKEEEMITLKATVTICYKRLFNCLREGADRVLDWSADHVHLNRLLLEIVSSELEQTGQEKKPEEKKPFSSYASLCSSSSLFGNEATFEATFTVPASFLPVGAVLVVNEHREEIFIKSLVVAVGTDHSAPLTFDCNSWVHPKSKSPAKRTFFPLKSYLPSQTPKGVESLRRSELAAIRGDGQGERKSFERIYDYDVYNDLGDPDHDADTKRPVLGGKDHPYPRRCRTGRPRSRTDPSSEVRHNDPLYVPYVPRDEAFSFTKWESFELETLWSVLHELMTLEHTFQHPSLSFPSFAAIDALFNLEKLSKDHGLEQLRNFITRIKKLAEYAFSFELPEIIKRDKFAWLKDEEFGRETLAGLNPLSIQLVTEFAFVSKLDEETYGSKSKVSLITKELIEDQIHGVMTAEEAVQTKKLFILDYHDMFLPYVNKVREQDGTTLYGSRTLFFLTEEGTLQPIAIELTRPKSPTKPQWRQVFTPPRDATGSWLWMLAKAHVLAHDTGYHELVSHWLRTHCCVEPYIIAANRQLSRMHPIYRLLHPHFRYTMEINARARQQLINAGGVIESTFSPGKYSMELSSAVYDKLWRFDMEALPADLIRRGMAVEHDSGKLELTIKDYPFANDGLLVWDSIKKWASDYVTDYYPSVEDITGDEELQGWWTEVRTKGHADKKDEPWWPVLDSHESLVQVLTTIMWVTSGHHAAVNFGQYPYAGYFPNRPTIARKNMPVEDEEEMEEFWNNPEKVLLDVFPSQLQAVKVMVVLHGLSMHSPDEEYMGKHAEPAWEVEPKIKKAFESFCRRMKVIEGKIDERNCNKELRNRCGAGLVPYELLKPFSGRGVTGKGIPNSISI